MVRMSDLVRGIVRESPAPEPGPVAPPPGPAKRPAVEPTLPVSIAAGELPAPVVRLEPPPAPRRAAAPSEPSEPLFGELQQFLVDARARASGRGFVWTRLESLVDRAIASLMRSPDLFWVANNPTAPPGVDYVAFHQARVCVLALRLGVNLGYDAARLLPLGQAAALFDVGLWQLPQTLVERADALSGNELRPTARIRRSPPTSSSAGPRRIRASSHRSSTTTSASTGRASRGASRGAPSIRTPRSSASSIRTRRSRCRRRPGRGCGPTRRSVTS